MYTWPMLHLYFTVNNFPIFLNHLFIIWWLFTYKPSTPRNMISCKKHIANAFLYTSLFSYYLIYVVLRMHSLSMFNMYRERKERKKT